MSIFETLSFEYLNELMAKRKSLNFIVEPVDLIANVGDAYGQRALMNLIIGKIRLNMSEPVLTTFLIFKNYIENTVIVGRLKQYRPMRRPMTNS